MPEHLLFLTGKLAEPHLHRVLEQMRPTAFTYRVHNLGLSVAGLMTSDMIARRLHDADGADRILVPGRCRGDLGPLSQRFGIPVERGPDELKDLPGYFGGPAIAPDLSRYDIRIFAEIVDAPQLDVPRILERAALYRQAGADVIDIGGLPNTPFPHLEDAIVALREAGHAVSVDSLDIEELRRGGHAGADYLLSLTEDTTWLADEVAAVPVLIPNVHGDLASLERAMEALETRGRPFLADPILDPIHFGFTEALARYRELRARHPGAEILMGVGNVTELTDADTSGINAVLFGIASELGIRNVLTTIVSPHARRAVFEADIARRIMFAAREQRSLPRDLHPGLLQIHARRPFPYSDGEIAEFAQQVRDPSYRVQVSEAGIHVYNRDGMHVATEPFALYPNLGIEDDAGHAFYLGVELARAEIAWQLGKRYNQDEPLYWGCATDAPPEDRADYRPPGATLRRQSCLESDA